MMSLRSLFSSIVVLLFVMLFAYVSIVEPVLETPYISSEDDPDVLFESATITHLYDGNVLWELFAEKAEIFKKDNRIYLSDVSGAIHEETSHVKFKSPYSSLDSEDGHLMLEDAEALFVIENEQVTLNADVILWLNDEKKIDGVGNVSLLVDTFEMTGPYFSVALPLQQMVFPQRSRVLIK